MLRTYIIIPSINRIVLIIKNTSMCRFRPKISGKYIRTIRIVMMIKIDTSIISFYIQNITTGVITMVSEITRWILLITPVEFMPRILHYLYIHLYLVLSTENLQMPLEEYVSLGIYRDEIFPHHLQGKYYRDYASTDLQVKYKCYLVFLCNDDISSKNLQ